MTFQTEKTIVQRFFDDLEKAPAAKVARVLADHCCADYQWQGVYPFREQSGTGQVAATFWQPLKNALPHMQRRQDIFIAGDNEISAGRWVMSMGNFMGLFDHDWLGIPATGKLVTLRYAEFNCVQNGKISRTGLFIDIIGLMAQAGVYPTAAVNRRIL